MFQRVHPLLHAGWLTLHDGGIRSRVPLIVLSALLPPLPTASAIAMSASTLTINVSDTSTEYTIDYQNPSTRATTYRDLKSLLSRLHNVTTDYREFADRGSGDKLADAANIDPTIAQLQLQPLQYDIRVQLYSSFYPVAAEELDGEPTDSVLSTDTVGALRVEVGRQLEMECSAITSRGRLLHDDQMMYELDLSTSAVNLLHSHLSVTIRDVETERDTKLDRLHNAMSVRDIKQLYAQKEKRVNIDSAEFTYRRQDDSTESVDSESTLTDEMTLWEARVGNDELLYMKTPSYTVQIREGVQVNDITVFDHYKPEQLKEEYNKVNASNPLTSGDALIFNNEQVGEGVEMYKLRLKAGSVIHVQREDVTLARFDYLCADCGNDVKLKKTDAIRCRECGHRVLFKKRTSKRQPTTQTHITRQRHTFIFQLVGLCCSHPCCLVLLLPFCCIGCAACQYLCR